MFRLDDETAANMWRLLLFGLFLGGAVFLGKIAWYGISGKLIAFEWLAETISYLIGTPVGFAIFTRLAYKISRNADLALVGGMFGFGLGTGLGSLLLNLIGEIRSIGAIL